MLLEPSVPPPECVSSPQTLFDFGVDCGQFHTQRLPSSTVLPVSLVDSIQHRQAELSAQCGHVPWLEHLRPLAASLSAWCATTQELVSTVGAGMSQDAFPNCTYEQKNAVAHIQTPRSQSHALLPPSITPSKPSLLPHYTHTPPFVNKLLLLHLAQVQHRDAL